METYFTHDAHALEDPKCMLLVSQLGMEGYGMFWALIEILRLQQQVKEFRKKLDNDTRIRNKLKEKRDKAQRNRKGIPEMQETPYFVESAPDESWSAGRETDKKQGKSENRYQDCQTRFHPSAYGGQPWAFLLHCQRGEDIRQRQQLDSYGRSPQPGPAAS